MNRPQEAHPEPKIKVKRNEKLPFNDWSKDKIRRGKKKCTSRTHKYPDDPRVDKIIRLPFWFIKKFLYELEGAGSQEELQKVVNQIFRKEVSEDRMFWVHFGEFKESITENNHQLDDFTDNKRNRRKNDKKAGNKG